MEKNQLQKYKKLKLSIKFILISLNILLVIINTFILYDKLQNLNFPIFKNIDNFTIRMISKSYNAIGDYLNKNKNDIKKYSKDKKIIKICINDNLYYDFYLKTIKYFLKDKYVIEINNNNPDYVISNVFENNLCKIKNDDNIIKISFYNENKIANLIEEDYSISFSHIHYLDRYFFFPISFFRLLRRTNIKNIENIRKQLIINNERKKFCGSVISNSYSTDFFRLSFIKELNKYKKIDMGGKYLNNVGGPVKNKIEFLSSYKFSIAMENTNGDGYISEKIIQSFYAGTIPIYYGDYMIDEFINPKSFILIKGQKDMYNKIEYIKKIDNDDKLYKKILMEKVIIDENIVEKYEKELSDFLIHIFKQDKNKAKRVLK